MGVLDIGSNSANLRVVDAYPGSPPSPVFRHKVATKLTEAIRRDGAVFSVDARRPHIFAARTFSSCDELPPQSSRAGAVFCFGSRRSSASTLNCWRCSSVTLFAASISAISQEASERQVPVVSKRLANSPIMVTRLTAANSTWQAGEREDVAAYRIVHRSGSATSDMCPVTISTLAARTATCRTCMA